MALYSKNVNEVIRNKLSVKRGSGTSLASATKSTSLSTSPSLSRFRDSVRSKAVNINKSTLTPAAQRYAANNQGSQSLTASGGAPFAQGSLNRGEEKEEKDNGGWLGGVGYVAEKAGLGFLQTFEGAVDYVSAAITSIFDEEAAKDILENDWVNYSHADEWFNPSEAWRVAGDVAGGIGTSLAGVGVGLAVSAIPGGAAVASGLALGVMGLGAAGTATKEAYMESGKLGLEEFAYGGAMGLVEAGTEWLSGGLGAGVTKAIGAFTKSAGKTATALTLKSFAKDMGKEFLSEAFEEGFSTWISPYVKRATYDPNAKNATAEEILYAGFVGGLSGLVMGGGRVGVTQIMNRADGSTAVREGRVSSIMDTAKAFSDYEGAHPTKLSSMEAVRDLYTRLEAQGVREAAKLTGEQRRALGELQTLTTSAVFESPMQKSALSAIAGAEAIAEKLNADGNIKMVDGKMQSVTPESIAELQKKGAEVRDITAEDIRAGVDAKNGKSVAKAMQKNDLLRYIVASDVAGRFMMTANEVETAARAGTKIKSQTDLNAFIENATDEQKSALGKELGIADNEWATMSLKRFNQAAASYRESGKLDAKRAEMKAAEQKKNAYAGEAVGGENADISELTSTEQGNVSVSGGNSLQNSENSLKTSENSLSPSVRFSIDNGKVVVDTDQNIFEGADRKDYGKIARNYMREHFRGKTVEDAEFTKVSEREYTSSRATQSLYKKSDGVYDTKMKASTELDNMLRVAKKIGHEDAKHSHDFNQKGYDRYEVEFSLNGNEFSGELLVAIDENDRRTFYDIVKIKKSDSPVSAGLAERGTNASSGGTDSATNSISQKSDLSTQNSENSSEKSSKEKIAELKERVDKKKIDAYCRENIEEYASMSAPNQSMIRQVVREGRVYGLDDADILSYARVAARSGLNIVYDENLDAKGNAGAYDPENNRIVVNPKAEKRQELILIHELDHAIRAYLGDDGKIHYLAYKGAEQRLSKETRDFVRGKEYSEQEIDVSREELFADEASAYYTEAILGPKVTVDMLLGKEPSLAKKILNFFTGAARAYSKDARLSKEARRHYKRFKKMFDDFAKWNQGRNAETVVESVGDGKASRKTYASINAKTADKMQLSNAREMLKNGASLEEVRKATGWFRGYDKKWRFEIDDSKMRVKIPESKYPRVGDMVEHSALFDAYPELKDIYVTVHDIENGRGSYSRTFGDIEISRDLLNKPEELKSVMAHELQHAVQDIEGLARGASLEYWEKKLVEGYDSRQAYVKAEEKALLDRIKQMRLDDANNDTYFVSDMEELVKMTPDHPRGEIDWDTLEQIEEDSPQWKAFDKQRDALSEVYGQSEVFNFLTISSRLEQMKHKGERFAVDLYFDTAGEVEARDVQKRLHLDATERKNTRPDIDREDVVFAEGADRFYDIITLDNGVKYVRTNKNLFLKPDGTEMSRAEAYNSLVGKKITLEDGDTITFVKNIPKLSVYNELFKKLPGYSPGVDVKAVSEAINKNILEIVEASRAVTRNEPQKHNHIGVSSFDTREVYLFDGGNAYRLELNIANLTDGTKIAYVKRYIEKADQAIEQKIKKAETSVQNQLNQPSANSISQKSNLSTGSTKKVSENSSDSGKSIRKSKDITAKLSDAEDSDKVTISKGQAQKLAANYNSDRVYDKKDVVKAFRGIDGFANLPEDMQKELLRDVWVGLNSRYGKGARETFVEVMSNKIPYMLLTESYTEENAKEYGRLQSAKKRAKKTLEGEALKEKLEAIDRELEKLENVPDRLFDTYEQSRIDEINREIAEALNKLLDGGKPSLRSKIEGEFDSSDAGKWKKKYIEAEFNETSAEKWKTKYYEARGRAKKLLNLSYQVQKMRDLKLGTFLNATDYKNEIFRETFDILGSINFRGNISPKTVRRAMARLAEWYAPDNPVLAEIDGQPGTRLFSDYIAIEINNIASGEGELSMHELDMLDNILRHATNIVENFNRVWKDGKWVEADKTAKAMIEVADETNILSRSGDMRRLGKRLGGWFKKYTTTFADPMTLFRYMDGYGNGFWTQMGEELRQAAFRHGVDLMEMKADYDAFNNGHKKYVKNASREVVEYGGAKMTKLQFMSLYMTMHRDQAARGLAENGFSFIDTDGNRVEVAGFLERMQDKVAGELGLERAEDGRWKVSDEQMKSLRESEISEMKKLLSDEDLEYIGIIERTLNGRCKELKTSRDMERLGFSNTISGYYYPIVRAMIAQNIDKRGMWGELDRASNISANKNTVKGAAGALWIESCDTVFNRHIDAVARYAELSPVIDTINKLFNLDVSGNKNKPRSIRTATFNSWQTGAALGAAQSDAQKHNGEAYLKELLSDVQGIGRERSVGNQLVENLRGGFAISALAGNPKVLMTQLSSVFASMNILSKSSLMMGIGRGFGKDVGAELDKYCPVAKLRNYDSAAAKAQGVLDEVRGVGEFLMKPIGFMDRQVVKMLWGAAQVEAEKTTKHKIGTEENKVEAGKILERVIFETQQNSVATEKSAAMRSTNMLMRSLTMFTSDAMKGVGRVIDAFGEVSALKARIRQAKASGDTAKVKTLEEKLKGASAQARRSVGALAMTALYMTIIARAFSWLYKKEEDEEDKTPLAFVADVFGGMLGGLPIISDVYDFFVSGYDLSDNVYDTMNGVLQGVSKVTNTAGKLIAGEATAADMNGATISAMQSIGTVLGLPIRNVRNMVMGLTRRFNPNAAYRLEMLSEAKNFASDFEEAINAGDEEKAAMILELLLREAVESGELKVENGDSGVSEALRGEILRMKTAGYNILPRTIGSTVTIAGEEIEMSAEEQTALRARYSEAIPSIESLVESSAYASLSDEQKESAVRFVYDVYYDAGIYELYGYERNMKRRIFSKIIAPEKLALANAVTAGLESDYEDERGRTISLEKWAAVKGTTARVNYSTVSGSKRKKVIAAINKLPLTTAEKLLIIAYKGYTIKDGDIRGVSAARAKQLLSRYARGQGLSADEAKALEGYL